MICKPERDPTKISTEELSFLIAIYSLNFMLIFENKDLNQKKIKQHIDVVKKYS